MVRAVTNWNARASSWTRPAGGAQGLLAALLVVMALASVARAEHFEYELTVTSAKDKARSGSDTYPPPQGRNPRPVCHAKVGEQLTFQFFMSSNFPHDAIKGVTVRYFIVPIPKVGSPEVPKPGDDALLNGHFIMDFKPDTGKVGLRQVFHADKPGVYLVRVQSENSDSDHEHFSALDLVVE
ncbi:MAG TPA: hypothetical protein VFW23_07130 [Tepidisphaeraceae bacterium]|nr:hypothetical protein [Tepidisphaeraceae bacterium]